MKEELENDELDNDPVLLNLFANFKSEQDKIQKSLDNERAEVVGKFREKLQKMVQSSVVDSLFGEEFDKLTRENNARVAEMNKELEKLKTAQKEELDDASKHFKEFYQKHSTKRVEDIKNQSILRLQEMEKNLATLKRKKTECQQLVNHSNRVLEMNTKQAAKVYDDFMKQLKDSNVRMQERKEQRKVYSNQCHDAVEKFMILSEANLTVANKFQMLLAAREEHSRRLEIAEYEAMGAAQNDVNKLNDEMKSELNKEQTKVFSDILSGTDKDETSLQQALNNQAVQQNGKLGHEMKRTAKASASLLLQWVLLCTKSYLWFVFPLLTPSFFFMVRLEEEGCQIPFSTKVALEQTGFVDFDQARRDRKPPPEQASLFLAQHGWGAEHLAALSLCVGVMSVYVSVGPASRIWKAVMMTRQMKSSSKKVAERGDHLPSLETGQLNHWHCSCLFVVLASMWAVNDDYCVSRLPETCASRMKVAETTESNIGISGATVKDRWDSGIIFGLICGPPLDNFLDLEKSPLSAVWTCIAVCCATDNADWSGANDAKHESRLAERQGLQLEFKASCLCSVSVEISSSSQQSTETQTPEDKQKSRFLNNNYFSIWLACLICYSKRLVLAMLIPPVPAIRAQSPQKTTRSRGSWTTIVFQFDWLVWPVVQNDLSFQC